LQPIFFMNNQPSHRAIIPNVSHGATRPLWSVMIPTYNCAQYLRETLSSVLAQDPGVELMQIEVVDDHSTKDDPEAVVRELGRDRVRFYQQPHNVGHTKNFEVCLERAQGHLVHLLHGDDFVLPGFYARLQAGFDAHPEVGAAFCRHIYMNEAGEQQGLSWLEQPESGILTNWLERIAVQQRIQTPSIVVRRSVYEQLGGFDQRIRYSEDWEMWVRIAAQYPVWYEPEPLASYRLQSLSWGGRPKRTGENIQDIRQTIEIIQDYLTPQSAKQLSKTALSNYASYALSTAQEFMTYGDTQSAICQIREAIKCSFSYPTLKSALKLMLRAWLGQKKQNQVQSAR
jgi:glycosyltransferase involved in cell wall biosynthesis